MHLVLTSRNQLLFKIVRDIDQLERIDWLAHRVWLDRRIRLSRESGSICKKL